MTAIAGGPVAAADITGLAALTTGKPLVRVLASGTQSIPNNALTALQFTGSEDIDTHNYHNPASSASRVTPALGGYYRVSGFGMITTTTSTVETFIGRNGTAVAGGTRLEPIGTGFSRQINASVILSANGTTDYFEILVLQNSGGAVLTNQSSRYTSTFEVEFLRPL